MMKLVVSPLLAVLALALVYEVVRHASSLPPSFLPSIPQILAEAAQNRHRLLEAAVHTISNVVLSLALTLPLGIGMGALMNWNRTIHDFLIPLLVTVKSLPAVALLPLLVVVFRKPMPVQIALTMSICFLPLTLAAYSGFRASAGPLRLFALAMTPERGRLFRLVTLPAAANELLLGLKIAMPLAFVGTLVAEMSSGGSDGLGNTILTAGNYSDMAALLSAIGVVALISTASYMAIVVVARRLFPANKGAWL
jgi:NitT/TauT family transport system permease protein